MVIVNPANEALRTALSETVDRKGGRTTHAIAVMPEDGSGKFSVILVDCSSNDSRYLSEMNRTKDVAEKDIRAVVQQFSAFASDDGEREPTSVPVFFNLDHEGDYRRCWVYADPVSLALDRQIVAPYNPC